MATQAAMELLNKYKTSISLGGAFTSITTLEVLDYEPQIEAAIVWIRGVINSVTHNRVYFIDRYNTVTDITHDETRNKYSYLVMDSYRYMLIDARHFMNIYNVATNAPETVAEYQFRDNYGNFNAINSEQMESAYEAPSQLLPIIRTYMQESDNDEIFDRELQLIVLATNSLQKRAYNDYRNEMKAYVYAKVSGGGFTKFVTKTPSTAFATLPYGYGYDYPLDGYGYSIPKTHWAASANYYAHASFHPALSRPGYKDAADILISFKLLNEAGTKCYDTRKMEITFASLGEIENIAFIESESDSTLTAQTAIAIIDDPAGGDGLGIDRVFSARKAVNYSSGALSFCNISNVTGKYMGAIPIAEGWTPTYDGAVCSQYVFVHKATGIYCYAQQDKTVDTDFDAVPELLFSTAGTKYSGLVSEGITIPNSCIAVPGGADTITLYRFAKRVTAADTATADTRRFVHPHDTILFDTVRVERKVCAVNTDTRRLNFITFSYGMHYDTSRIMGINYSFKEDTKRRHGAEASFAGDTKVHITKNAAINPDTKRIRHSNLAFGYPFDISRLLMGPVESSFDSRRKVLHRENPLCDTYRGVEFRPSLSYMTNVYFADLDYTDMLDLRDPEQRKNYFAFKATHRGGN